MNGHGLEGVVAAETELSSVDGERGELLLAGYRVLAPRGIEVDVNLVGKAATWILYAAIGFRIVTHTATRWPLDLFWAGLGLALVAAVFYIGRAWGEVRR